MHRAKSQHSKAQQSNTPHHTDKSKPTPKNKGHPESSVNHKQVASPTLLKPVDADKENGDIVSTIIKVVSAAAEAREREILLNLVSHLEKQRKIKQYLNSHKQVLSDKQELQAMLTHLRQEQAKDIRRLKVQIGKRKLQALDRNDLKEDILNLNSYVMRRSKKQSEALRNEGVDLLTQIYTKIDQQQKIIAQLAQRNSKKNAIRDKTNETLEEQSQKDDRDKLVKTLGENCSNNELMHKILKLEKENLRLMKEIGKIEEEFQFVVEEKLILEEKLDRVQARFQEKQVQLKRMFCSFTTLISEKISQLNNLKEDVLQMTLNMKQCLQLQIRKISDMAIILEQSISQQHRRNSYSEFSGVRSDDQQEKEESPIVVKASMSSSISCFETYEATITEKQLEINSLLKMLGTEKNEKEELSAHLLRTQEQNQKLESMLKNCKRCLQLMDARMKDLKLQLTKILQQQKNQNRQLFTFLSEQISAMESENIKQKQCLMDRLKQCEKENSRWENMYYEYRQQTQHDKVRITEQFSMMENQLKNIQDEVIKNLHQEIENKDNIIREKDQEINKLCQSGLEKLEKILFLQNQGFVFSQDLEKIRCQLDEEKINNNQLHEINQNIAKQVLEISQKLQEMIRQKDSHSTELEVCRSHYEYQKSALKLEIENSRNLLIEECGMLLETKIEEIRMLQIQIHREKMVQEDIFSWLARDNANYTKKQQSVLQRVQTLRSQISSLEQARKSLKACLEYQTKNIMTQINNLFSEIPTFSEPLKQKQSKLTLQQGTLNLAIAVPNPTSSSINQFFQQIYFSLPATQKTKYEYLLQGDLSMVLKLPAVISILSSLRQQVGISSYSEQEDDQENEDKCEMEELRASCWEIGAAIKPEDPSLGDVDLNLQIILDQSGLVDEVEGLRNELRQSLSRNDQLEKELRFYQEKEMDNIFDF